MKKNKLFLALVCLIFMFNSFTFNVYALSDETSSKAIENVKIISSVNASLDAVEAWARSKNATETFVNLAKIYKKYAESRGGVNWVVAYVQAAKETGYGKFGGVLDESYHNPCGLKNPSGGDDNDANAHKRFDNWDQGVIAHLDHLALYAAASGYPKTVYVDSWKDSSLSSNETYDPRHIGWFGTVDGIFGKAKDVLGLTGSWASDPNYGESLVRLYCDAINFKYLPTRSDLELPANSEVITNDKLRIKGWALSEGGVKEVKILIDNSQVATINTGINRPDIDLKYPGYINGANSGFDKTIDISKFDTGNKTVEVKIVFTNGEIQSYKRNIVIKRAESEKELPFRSTLDEPVADKKVTSDKLKIRGWALANSGVKEVRVYVDGKDLGTVPYGTLRADVNKVYPGYSSGNNPGFDGTINISSISAGNKNLTIKITANDGTTQTIERAIKVEKLASRSCLDEPT
ncbi:glucosaminidase domain-containing protein, partial [uncultured Clostridium sp.]